MRVVLVVLVVVGMVGMTGCKKKPRQDLVQIPPPPSDVGSEPVYVGPATAPPGAAAPAPLAPTATYYQPPAGAAAPLAPAPTPAIGKIHIVRRGDTLWSIALQYYGDGQRFADIQRANGITDAKKLRVGQRLALP